MELYRIILSLFLISYNTITARPSEAAANIFYGNLKFSSELYEILARNDGNVLFSPISVHSIMSLVYQAAAGKTAMNLKNGLHLSEPKIVAKGYQNIMQNLNSVENATLSIANKVFVKQQYKLKDEFSSIAKNDFLSEVENVDFKERVVAAKHINDWVEEKTYNKITKAINPDDLDHSTRMILMNAIYFKGDWMGKFDANLTNKEKFYLSESDTVETDMMHMNGQILHGRNEHLDAQIISLPYTNEHLNLIVILPNSKTGIKDIEEKLKTTSLTDIIKYLDYEYVDLSLPKFKIETRIDLNDSLTELGMGVIFSGDAEFPNIIDNNELLKVSQVVQKAFIEVNEEGTEAAAVTGLIVTARMAPLRQNFQADHPFIFVLTYKYNDALLPLFVGKLAKP